MVSLALLVSSQPGAQQGTPQFKTRVDLIQLDVSVTDKNHQPVRGLTADDFTVIESGQKQTIQAFVPIDLPEEPPRAPGWMRDVAPDVNVNTGVDEDRLVVLLIDDYSEDVAKDLWAQKGVKQIAKGIIDKLGPRDLAAVIYTVGTRNNQEFTHDRARLLAAVDGFNPAAVLPDFAAMAILEHTVEVLGSVEQRRKVLVWISPAVVPPGSNLRSVIKLAQLYNVNVYPIDPAGIRVGTLAEPAPSNDYNATAVGTATDPMRMSTPRDDVERMNNIERLNRLRENMFVLANLTGGHSFQYNEFTKSVAQVVRETGSFYLLGYVSTNTQADDKFRPLEVKVNRKGVTVHAREANVPPILSDSPKSPAAALPAPALEALAGLVPVRGVPLSITAMPFASELAGSSVGVAVALVMPAPADGADDFDALIKAFTFDGVLKQTKSLHVHAEPRRSAAGADRQIQVVERLDIPPGRYQLRVGVTSAVRKASGSVYLDLDVPDFNKDPLSLSGVALTSSHDKPVLSVEAQTRMPPAVPTTTRAFDKPANVIGFIEICQGGAAKVSQTIVDVTIRDDREQVVFKQNGTIEAVAFDAAHRAPYRIALPLAKLAPGEYLLTFDVRIPTAAAKRDVRFKVN